jgi:GUN4-like/Caspase domain
MARVALLIGVSEYGTGLRPLPAASRDVEALQQVLAKKDIGNFDAITALVNPNQSEMAEAIETWAVGHQPDDVALLFFSGYRVYDEHHNLYFAAQNTHRNTQDRLIKASAVSASFVRDCLEQSHASQQVIILDWCLGESSSGLFNPFERNGSTPSLEHQLGNPGRVVLLSSANRDYSFAQKRSDCSLYTCYLMEGLKDGIADQDQDGQVSAYELHEYVSRKVKEAAPRVTPKIFGATEQGISVQIAKANIAAPSRKYRQEVERYTSHGCISDVGRSILDIHRVGLGLSLEQATAIEDDVLRPYRDYENNLQQYREAVSVVEHEYLLDESVHNSLRSLQRILGLRDEDVAPIQAEMTAKVDAYQRESKHRERLNNLQRYSELFAAIAKQPPPQQSRMQDELKDLQELWELQDGDVAPIQDEIKSQLMAEEEAYRRKLRHYEFEFSQAIGLGLPISSFTRDGLKKFQQLLGLCDEDVIRIERHVMEQSQGDAEAYQLKLQHYEFEFSQEVERHLPLAPEMREKLNKLKQFLGLREDDASQVEQRAIAKVKEQEALYRQNLRTYEERLIQILDFECPPGDFARYELDKLCQQLGLNSSDVQQIDKDILAPRMLQKAQQQQALATPIPEEPQVAPPPPQSPSEPIQAEPPPLEELPVTPATVLQPPSPPPPPVPPIEVELPTQSLDELASERGIDYTRLRDLLRDKRWREADEETLAVMLRATGREKPGWLDKTAIEQFPCTDLTTIDQLWITHSNGQFGFSVQHRLYTDLPNRDAPVFGDRVGWWQPKMKMFVHYNKLTFSPQAKLGHLPAYWFWKIPPAESLRSWGMGSGRGGCATDAWMLATMMSRMEACQPLG